MLNRPCILLFGDDPLTLRRLNVLKLRIMRLLGTFMALMFSMGIMQAQVAAPDQPQLLESEEVSDQKVDQFVSALEDVHRIQQESQPKMIKAIEDEGMDPQQFVQAAQAMQQGAETGLNEADQKKFDVVQEKVMKIQIDANSEMETKIKEKDLSLEEFNQIYLSFQQKPALKQRIESRIAERSQE